MTRPTFDTNADFTPRIVGITTNRHNFGLPASLCAAVAKPQDDKPAKVVILIEAAVALSQELQTQVNELRAWKEKTTSIILQEILVD